MRKMLLLLILAALSSTVFVAAQKVWDDDYRTGPYGSHAYAYVEAYYVYTQPPNPCYFNFHHAGHGGASVSCIVLIWVYPGEGQSSRYGGYTRTDVWDVFGEQLFVSAYAHVGRY
jgi:hypothetical protein